MRRWTRSDTQCRRRRAVGEGAAVAWKLGGGGHGGRALARAHDTESEQERRGKAEGVRASRSGAPLHRVKRGACGREQRRMASMSTTRVAH